MTIYVGIIVTNLKFLHTINSKWEKYSGILFPLTGINFTVNVPNEINGLEYLFSQEQIF